MPFVTDWTKEQVIPYAIDQKAVDAAHRHDTGLERSAEESKIRNRQSLDGL